MDVQPLAFERDLVIFGGCGHVGLPLGIAFATRGRTVALYDVDAAAVDLVNAGLMPFLEQGADELLPAVQASGRFIATTDPGIIGTAATVVVVVGTPVNRHLSPDIGAVMRALDPDIEQFLEDQLLVLRSTVYPGVTAMIDRRLRELGKEVHVAFCPERIAEGHALEELSSLPQIVSGCDEIALERATALFRSLTDDIIELTPEEAELAKLFTNTWRYIKFATANQLFMIANDCSLDFERIRSAITHGYPRAADMPGPGFTAGPCLFKDTMQIAAFNVNRFTLGHASVIINEGLPLYVVSQLEHRYALSAMKVGILGMAFKGGSDDVRSSLSYKLKRILALKARKVLCTDPRVTSDPDLVPLKAVIAEADLVIIAAPHKEYRGLELNVPSVDLCNLLGKGVVV